MESEKAKQQKEEKERKVTYSVKCANWLVRWWAPSNLRRLQLKKGGRQSKERKEEENVRQTCGSHSLKNVKERA